MGTAQQSPNTQPTESANAQLEQWLASNEADELRDDIYRVDVYSDGSPKGSRLPAQVYGRTAAEALRRGKLIAATPSLYAYARADELLSKFEWAEIESEKGRVAKGEFEAQLRSMGWDGDGSRLAFLQTYRAAALAKAEGKQ